MSQKVLISVIGPTAIGKTSLAISLANHFKTEIISADSRQFYKEMRIGTAVPSKDELKEAKHHFIQHKSIHYEYSVGAFEKEASTLLTSLFEKNDIVIMVGGSGLYIDAVTKGLDDFPKVDPEIRVKLTESLKKEGIGALQAHLQKLDPTYYSKIDIANPHRLIRALEICIGTGKPFSSFINKKKKERNFKTVSVGIHAERPLIYDRINKRVDLMVEEGLVAEAEILFKHKELNALQTVGYKELFNYFLGDWDKDFAVSEIKKNTRRFAKRQLTWFRKNENTLWIDFHMPHENAIKKICTSFNLNK